MIDKMTFFATSHQHSHVATARALVQRSATEPSLPIARYPDTVTNQTSGLERLLEQRTAKFSTSTIPTVPLQLPVLTNTEKAEQEKQALAMDQVKAEKEFNWYIAWGLEKGHKLLHYWDLNKKEFPLIFGLAMDVLPVEASAVPYKCVFSLSKETITLRQSHLSPGLMEVLQVLKYSFKQDCLNFTKDWIAKEEDYTPGGRLTEAAVWELMLAGKVDELSDLLRSASETNTKK
ncbi:hypothetical protein H0H81_006900 [Sphagnurus paluster]|uniref:HAT C-terminal dimerisation domain-containing protein n=1 Tax=Sphagnurus paluster TaxID=117069 RepID=A0A9P7FTI2_9AGAR|nr:hypothetical protein H0H81_006900 [Sphagnurus paluster]